MLEWLALLLIRGYRFFLSPFLGNACRFTPTCSAYTEEAIKRYGVWRGSWMGLKRIGRCHPYYKGAWVDPVPERTTSSTDKTLSEGQIFGTTAKRLTNHSQNCHARKHDCCHE